MFKFLHLADVHFDTLFLGRSEELRQHLRAALKTAFRRAVDCALREKVDAVLIAGDLYDDERLSLSTEQFLLSQLQRLSEAGIACFYATGNYDPGGEAFRAAHIEWPDSVHCITSREPRVFHVRDGSGAVRFRVVGAGHARPDEQENLAEAFPKAEDGVPHVGLLHAHVSSAEGAGHHGRRAPCRVEDLRRTGYAYWALGHVHERQEVDEEANAWYAGNLQGCLPSEAGAKGGLLVTVNRNRPTQVVFRSFAPTRRIDLSLDQLEEVRTLRLLIQAARQVFREVVQGEAVENRLLRIRLQGPCPLAGELVGKEQLDDLEETLADELNVLDVEVHSAQLTRPVDVSSYREEIPLIGEVLDVVEQATREDELLDELAPALLAAGPEEADQRRAYLRSLLHKLDREATARLLEEGTA